MFISKEMRDYKLTYIRISEYILMSYYTCTIVSISVGILFLHRINTSSRKCKCKLYMVATLGLIRYLSDTFQYNSVVMAGNKRIYGNTREMLTKYQIFILYLYFV